MARKITTLENLRVVVHDIETDDEVRAVAVPEEHMLEALKLIHAFDIECANGEYSRSEDRHFEAYTNMEEAVIGLLGVAEDEGQYSTLECESETEFEV